MLWLESCVGNLHSIKQKLATPPWKVILYQLHQNLWNCISWSFRLSVIECLYCRRHRRRQCPNTWSIGGKAEISDLQYLCFYSETRTSKGLLAFSQLLVDLGLHLPDYRHSFRYIVGLRGTSPSFEPHLFDIYHTVLLIFLESSSDLLRGSPTF